MEQINIRPLHPGDSLNLYHLIRRTKLRSGHLQLPGGDWSEVQSWLQKPVTGWYRLAALRGDESAGFAFLYQPQSPRMAHLGQIGLLHEGAWDEVINSRLLAAIVDLADNWLNLKRLEFPIFADNEAALDQAMAAGFKSEGIRRCIAQVNDICLDDQLMVRLRDLPKTEVNDQVDSKRRRKTGDNPEVNKPIVHVETIRPVEFADLAQLYDIFRQPTVCRGTLQLPSQEIGRIQTSFESPSGGNLRYVAVVKGQVVGNVNLRRYQEPWLSHSARLGMSVHPDYWDQRIGTRLMEHILEQADGPLDIKRIELDVYTDNLAGIRLYKKNDFKVEGVKVCHTFGDGRWANSYFMARLI